MTRLYIAGPMTGLPEYNYPAFHAAEAELAKRGLEVLNPAATPTPVVNAETAWVYYMRAAIGMVIRADALCLLPGWQQSKGANVEVSIAEALELDIRPYDEWLKESIVPS